jgi:hypothetical protein
MGNLDQSSGNDHGSVLKDSSSLLVDVRDRHRVKGHQPQNPYSRQKKPGRSTKNHFTPQVDTC